MSYLNGKVSLLLILLWAQLSASLPTQQPRCKDPSHQSLSDQLALASWGDNLGLNCELHNLRRRRSVESGCPRNFNEECSSRTMDPYSPCIQDRMMCPYLYKLQKQDGRFPSGIFEAECVCSTSCLNDGTGLGNGKCQEVSAKRLVLIRDGSQPCNDQGEYVYIPDEQWFPVSCVCALPREYSKPTTTQAPTTTPVCINPGDMPGMCD